MNLIFFGPQGSGKGTQAKIISEKMQLKHVSTGDLLRNTSGKLKKEVDSYINSGNLVPDELIIKILKEEISKPEYKSGFILDGFPRNISQVLALDKITKIDKVIEISISDEEAISRIVNRISCKSCGFIFNIKTNPSKLQNTCDNCNSKLEKRSDDNEEAIKKRLAIYKKDTSPILLHYKAITINGQQEIDKVTQDILNIL